MKAYIFFSLFLIFACRIQTYSQVPLHPPPVPYFFITGLCFGDSTHFINKTGGGIISNTWSIMNDKGDTIYTSGKDNATYYFKKRGYYSVCLSAYNGHTATKIRVIKVDTVVKANCSFRNCYDVFDNLSACSDQFIWVLPDNSISTERFPAYTFNIPGDYPVKLIAKKGNKTDTLQKSIHVRGDSVGIPNAAFTSKLINPPSTFLFTAVDSLAHAYSWYFGDNQGDDSSGYKVIHLIDKSVYTPPVNLFVTNGCGTAVDMMDPFSITEIAEEKIPEQITIYPNPVIDELKVIIGKTEIRGPVRIQLLDMNGCILKEDQLWNMAMKTDLAYDVHSLLSGVYILMIRTEKQCIRKKIIVEK